VASIISYNVSYFFKCRAKNSNMFNSICFFTKQINNSPGVLSPCSKSFNLCFIKSCMVKLFSTTSVFLENWNKNYSLPLKWQTTYPHLISGSAREMNDKTQCPEVICHEENSQCSRIEHATSVILIQCSFIWAKPAD
jgi:hypothetical protein